MSDDSLLAIAHATSAPEGGYVQSIRMGRHALTSDEPAAIGGTDAGPAPYQLLASALASCTGITLRMYAQRKGWELGEVKVDVTITRTTDGEHIARTLRFGAPVTAEQQQRLLEIAGKTPVTKTLLRGTPIDTKIGDG